MSVCNFFIRLIFNACSICLSSVLQVRVLDFRRIRLREREAAKKLFHSKCGKELQKEVSRNKAAAAANTFIPGAGLAQHRSKTGWFLLNETGLACRFRVQCYLANYDLLKY